MGDKKEMQYRGYYAVYRYDENLEIWYGKARVAHLPDSEDTEPKRVLRHTLATGSSPETPNSRPFEYEVAFASMNRVDLEKQFRAIVESDICKSAYFCKSE